MSPALRPVSRSPVAVPRTAAISLAKTYISYGLGVEANHTLKGVTLPATDRYILAMADIVEDGVLDGQIPNGWYFDCAGASALWAVLAASSIPRSTSYNEDAILRSFSALQPHLRAHLGPSLFAKIQERDTESALLPQLLKVMERGREAEDTSVKLASVDLAFANGETETALRTLDDVIEANEENAPTALIEKIDALIELRQTVPFDQQKLAEAYSKEYRGDALEMQLVRVSSLALASANEVDASFAELAKIAGKLQPVELEATASYLFSSLAANADDVKFLNHSFAANAMGYPLKAEVENAVAKRMIELGFPDKAEYFLNSAAKNEAGRVRRVLRAQAALGLGLPRRAEVELLGLTGVDIEELRGRARMLSDDHRSAQISFVEMGDNEQAAEQAWLGSDWEALQALDTDDWQAEQRLTAAQGEQVVAPKAALAGSHALLQESSGMRTDIEMLLSRHGITDALPAN